MTDVELLHVNGSIIEVAPDYDALSQRLREVFLGRVAVKPNLKALVPTGESPLAWYAKLSEHQAANPGAFENVAFYNLDEYCWLDEDGCRLLDPDDARSYRYYMSPIVNSLGIKASFFPGAENYYQQGIYDAQIEHNGGIDFAVQGIGLDHTCGFNFAGSPFDSVTRLVQVSDLTRQVNASITDTEEEAIPSHAVTVGIGTVMKAAEVWTIAYGERKQEPVAHAVHDIISTDNPATALRNHPNHRLLVDEAAAALL